MTDNEALLAGDTPEPKSGLEPADVCPPDWDELSDWRKLKRLWEGFKAEVAQAIKYAPKAWEAIKRRDFKTAFNPNNPLATLLMEFLGIEGCQIFQPYFRPESDAPNLEINGSLRHPHKYWLQNFRVIDLHLETGEQTTAWYHAPKEGSGFPTIVYCHGALGTLYDRQAQLDMFAKRGFGVIIAAYPGMKSNKQLPRGTITLGGQPFPAIEPTEELCVETVRAMVLYVLNHNGVLPYDDDNKSLSAALTERGMTYSEREAQAKGAEISGLQKSRIHERERKKITNRMSERAERKPPPEMGLEQDPMKKVIVFGESMGSCMALKGALLLEKGEDPDTVKYKALTGQLPIMHEKDDLFKFQVDELCKFIALELNDDQKLEACSALRNALGIDVIPDDKDIASDLLKAINKIHRNKPDKFAAFLQELKSESGLPSANPLAEYKSQTEKIDDPKIKEGRESLTVPAVICWAPNTSLVDQAHRQFPGFNADLWLHNRFETKKAIDKTKINYDKTKVLVMHGTSDTRIHPANSQMLKKLSGENKSKICPHYNDGYNADTVFLEGCNHASTKNNQDWGPLDETQLSLIGNVAQQWLSEQGLCPAPAEQPNWDRVSTSFNEPIPIVQEADEPLTFNRSSGIFTKDLSDLDGFWGFSNLVVMTSVIVHPDNTLHITIGRALDEANADSAFSGYRKKMFDRLRADNIPVDEVKESFVNKKEGRQMNIIIPAEYGQAAARALELNSDIQAAIGTNQLNMIPANLSDWGNEAENFVDRTSRDPNASRDRG